MSASHNEIIFWFGLLDFTKNRVPRCNVLLMVEKNTVGIQYEPDLKKLVDRPLWHEVIWNFCRQT